MFLYFKNPRKYLKLNQILLSKLVFTPRDVESFSPRGRLISNQNKGNLREGVVKMLNENILFWESSILQYNVVIFKQKLTYKWALPIHLSILKQVWKPGKLRMGSVKTKLLIAKSEDHMHKLLFHSKIYILIS